MYCICAWVPCVISVASQVTLLFVCILSVLWSLLSVHLFLLSRHTVKVLSYERCIQNRPIGMFWWQWLIDACQAWPGNQGV